MAQQVWPGCSRAMMQSMLTYCYYGATALPSHNKDLKNIVST